MALEGRLEWSRITNPFASQKRKEKPDVADKLRNTFDRMGAVEDT